MQPNSYFDIPDAAIPVTFFQVVFHLRNQIDLVGQILAAILFEIVAEFLLQLSSVRVSDLHLKYVTIGLQNDGSSCGLFAMANIEWAIIQSCNSQRGLVGPREAQAGSVLKLVRNCVLPT